MSRPTQQQHHAELLYASLLKDAPLLKDPSLQKGPTPQKHPDVKIIGAGVHWKVLVTSAQNSCTIHCFHYDYQSYKGPEYYIWLYAQDQRIATGRSRNQEETLTIIRQWIKGASLEKLCQTHAILDKEKRQLQHIEAKLLHYNDILEQTTHDIVEGSFNNYSLIFQKDERACTIGHGSSDALSCTFTWDGSTIFKTTEPVSESLAWLITDWVLSKAKPSMLKDRYPDLSFSLKAEYYEKGNGIEGEFLDSWDEMHVYFDRHHSYSDEMVMLIYIMREKGFDHQLRAGQSMNVLILSRSRRHGLRNDQPFLRISMEKDTMTVSNATETLRFNELVYNDTLDRLLHELAAQSIA